MGYVNVCGNSSPCLKTGDSLPLEVEDYHGTKVTDPYRWLENPSSEDTLAWVEAQNALMSHYFEAIPARKKIQARMTALWDYAKYSVPVKREASENQLPR